MNEEVPFKKQLKGELVLPTVEKYLSIFKSILFLGSSVIGKVSVNYPTCRVHIQLIVALKTIEHAGEVVSGGNLRVLRRTKASS